VPAHAGRTSDWLRLRRGPARLAEHPDQHRPQVLVHFSVDRNSAKLRVRGSWASIRESGRRQRAKSGAPAECVVLDAGNRVTRVRIPDVSVWTTPDRVAPTAVSCGEAVLGTRATLEDVGPS
jgi:hypothetical protein